MNSVYFISLGCAKNLVDTEVMLGMLSQEGFLFVDNPDKADIIIINTCAFIKDAKTEAIDTILEMGAYKKNGSCKQLIVAGCLPQRYSSDLVKSMPEVDVFLGSGEFHRIAEILKTRKNKNVFVNKPVFLYDHNTPRIRVTEAHYAYLKISEGCFHPCSFCVIPKLRGKYRSRKITSIIKEAKKMLDCGVKEINLIGQDTTAYGRDLKSNENLETLLRKLATMPYDKWIRLFYTYPHGFPIGAVHVMKAYSDICRYIDIPVQHISDEILKSMRREGSSSEIYRLMDYLRAQMPDVSLRTSIIVGFPGETDDDFYKLVDFVSWAKFDHLGVFKYSNEEGTYAAGLKGQVPQKIIDLRFNEVMKLQQEISFDKNRGYVGKVRQVLVERESKQGGYEARHMGQGPEVDGKVYIEKGRAKVGSFELVKITDFSQYDLKAMVVSTSALLREGIAYSR